jgi:hypothetical protein
MLQHYTVETGHCRISPRSEVSEQAVAVLQPLLTTGEHDVPGMFGYRCRVTVFATVLAATVVARSGAPLITTLVCPDANSLVIARDVLALPHDAKLLPPCALVRLHPTIVLDLLAADWLGDFERCIAWAWLYRLRESGSPHAGIAGTRA